MQLAYNRNPVSNVSTRNRAVKPGWWEPSDSGHRLRERSERGRAERGGPHVGGPGHQSGHDGSGRAKGSRRRYDAARHGTGLQVQTR